jgi:hypothetical protein
MKRWLGWFLLAVGIGFLLWIPHRPVSVPPCAGAALRTQNEFVSNWCRALRDAVLALAWSRAGPRNLFATAFTLLIRNITDEDGPPWLDYRGPPGPNACSHRLVTVCKAAGQAGSQRGEDFPQNSGLPECKFKNGGFSTAFS